MMRLKSKNRHLPLCLLSYGTVTQDMYDYTPIDISSVYNVAGILWREIHLQYMYFPFFFPCPIYIYFSLCNVGYTSGLVTISRPVPYECLVAVTSSVLTVGLLVSHLLPIFPFLFSIIFTVVSIIIIVTYTHGTYNYIPEKKHFSRLCNVAATGVLISP